MAAIGWILIGGFILFVLLLLAKDEYHDRREKKRRLELRAEIEWLVEIKTDEETLEGKTLNISAGGALLCCPNKFALNEVISLTIKPTIRAPFEITAEVVRTDIQCSDGDNTVQGTAVRFIIISEKDRQFVSFSVFEHVRDKKLSSDYKEKFEQA